MNIYKVVTSALWYIANLLVDNQSPGDFNQALMELGATICTPKNPNCSICPISVNCLAFEEAKQTKGDNKNRLLSMKSKLDTKDIEDCVTSKRKLFKRKETFKWVFFFPFGLPFWELPDYAPIFASYLRL